MTATTPARTSLLRLVLLAASFCAVACDAEPQDSYIEQGEVCGPEDGCDGIAEVQERDGAQSANVEPNLTSVHGPPTHGDSLGVAVRTNPVGPTELRLPVPTCDRDDADLSYVADDPETCAVLLFTCAPGWRGFQSECGCGCEFTGDYADGFHLRAE